jgi:superfamily I DNA/RNA helicase
MYPGNRVNLKGNMRRSIQEADNIVQEVVKLLDTGRVRIRGQPTRAINTSDILILTPYNVQRLEITDRLRRLGLESVKVGTVDKFQGQEAAVVFTR